MIIYLTLVFLIKHMKEHPSTKQLLYNMLNSSM